MKTYIPSTLKDIHKLRPSLLRGGVLVERVEGRTTCVAANNVSLVAVEFDADDHLHPPHDEATEGEGAFVVPKKDWVESFRSLPSRPATPADAHVGVSVVGDKRLRLTSGPYRVNEIDVDESHYPRWRRVVPTEYSMSIKMDVDELASTLAVLKTVVGDSRRVTLHVPTTPTGYLTFTATEVGTKVTAVVASCAS